MTYENKLPVRNHNVVIYCFASDAEPNSFLENQHLEYLLSTNFLKPDNVAQMQLTIAASAIMVIFGFLTCRTQFIYKALHVLNALILSILSKIILKNLNCHH